MKRFKRNKAKRRAKRGNLFDLRELDPLRAAGKLAASILDQVESVIEPGITTEAIDQLVHQLTTDAGAISAPYGYRGFPKHCCTSINEVVCHGIPDPDRVLQDGDIINVDVTPILNGHYGDSSRMFCVGEVSAEAKKLVDDTYMAMWLGIHSVAAGGHVGEIGQAIQPFAEAQGYSVVREFTGHGIGTEFHCAPTIPHHVTFGAGETYVEGLCFTIEPMINLGRWKTKILADDWTAITVDGALSAQWEHMIVVTREGCEVMTLGANETPPSREQTAAILAEHS